MPENFSIEIAMSMQEIIISIRLAWCPVNLIVFHMSEKSAIPSSLRRLMCRILYVDSLSQLGSSGSLVLVGVNFGGSQLLMI